MGGLGALGCGAPTIAWLEPPPDARALIVAEEVDLRVSFEVIDLTKVDEGSAGASRAGAVGAPVFTRRVDGEVAVVEALMYRATVDDLELVVGPLTPNPLGTRPLQTPDYVFASRVSPDESGEWRVQPGMSGRLAEARLEAEPCPFTVESFELRGTGIIGVFALDPDRVIVSSLGSLEMVTTSGDRTPMAVRGLGPEESVSDLEWTSADEGWAGGSGVWRVRRVAPAELELTRTSTPPEYLIRIASANDQVLAIGARGGVYRIDSAEVEVVHKFPDPGFGTQRGNVFPIWDGQFMAVYQSSREALISSREEGVRLETISLDVGMSTANYVPGIGAVAGSTGVLLVRSLDTGWAALEGNRFAPIVRVIEPFRDGFVYGGGNGYLARYHGTEGFCADPTQVRVTAVEHMVVLPDGTIMVSGDNEATGVGTIQAIRAPPDE
ncbi:MAG: hypothetical protein HYV07_33230 [Deltaproteobacteria bacterium]|nr:hypothetical protein [Deltaproteobacteria bacterium]